MKRITSAVALIVSMIAGGQGYAQVNDAGLWASVTLEKKITQRFIVALSEEVRFNENISEVGTYFTDLGVGYRFGKKEGIRLSGNYRYTNRRRVDDSYSTRHRYYIDLTLRKAFGPLVPIYRNRFQAQYSDILTSEDGRVPTYYNRSRFMLKYDPGKRYEPYISTEFFVPMHFEGGFGNAFSDLAYDEIRFAAGVDYEFNERSVLGIGYLHDREFFVKNPQRSWVATIGYTYTF